MWRKLQPNIHESVSKATLESDRRPFSQTVVLGILLVIVCVVVAAAHWPALSAQALSFDDGQYLTENLLVQNPGWASVRRLLTEVLEPSTVEGYYQPLTMISLMVDYALGGRSDNLLPFHRTSLALHVMNTALVILLLYLLFGRAEIAAAVGLLFGLHPMTVEPVAWVGERKTLLAAFFALWCLIFYVRYTRKSDLRLYLGCIVMYVLAVMSKPTSLPLPAVMLLMDYWPLERWKGRDVLEKLPFFAVAVISAIITYVSQSRTAAVTLPGEYGPQRVTLTLCHNIVFYLCKIVWPANLSSYYAFPRPFGLSNPMVLAGVIGTCILIVLLVISLRWTPAALTGWLFFFVAIFPTMGVVGFTIVIAADKYAYLPSIGLLMILTSFLGWFCGTGTVSKSTVRHVVVAIIVLILAGGQTVATRRYLVHWRDSVSLYEHMLTLAPHAAPVHDNLGIALKLRGKVDKAITHYRQALQFEPDNAGTHNNLGIALQSKGRLDEAISHYRHALRVRPDHAKAHNSLGSVLSMQGKFDEAISHYLRALDVKPDYAEAHSNLGIALKSRGRLDEAISHYRQALRLRPDSAEVHYNLANALIMTGRLDEALKHFREALHLKPDWLTLLTRMASILAAHPDTRLRDAGQAICLAERAAELTQYQNASVLGTLATAYAAAGQFDRAVTVAHQAIALASADQDNKLAENIRKQLELYRQAKP